MVLSACNTAAGDTARCGGAVGPGARLLLRRGPRAAGLALAGLFRRGGAADHGAFAELDRDPKAGRAEALQRAMIALMDDRSQADNAHPAVWAPFVVVGEGGR